MRSGGAGSEIAVAPALLAAQRANSLHVAENEIVLVDAECRQHFRQLIGGMRSMANHRLQIGGRHPQFARDPAEVGASISRIYLSSRRRFRQSPNMSTMWLTTGYGVS